MTRTAFAVSLFVSFLGALPAPVAAQAYPARPIRIIVPYPAGGTSDILARSLGEKLTGALGQAVVVENKPGANGNLGADLVAKSPPDGYTLLLADIGALAISPSVYPTLPFDPVRDFAPVTMVAYSPHILVVNPAVPANSVQELVSLTKSKPGKLNFAISGVGGAPHLAGVEFALRTGVKWEYIPYKGGSQAIADVAAGQADVTLNGMLATYPLVKGGKLKLLAVSSPRRVGAIPDVPTIAESGLPGFETGSWQGVVAPPGTPREIVARLNAEIGRILAMPEMRDKLGNQGADVRTNSPDEFAAFIRTEKDRWAKVVKEADVKIE
ncbi:MAG: tripartite tricarboxylate transporter substrate binding protein [Betaproteobacteria bacterium]|nr:MAG: tripartite tricarboxylate transporter substrate binding protein [Betaproteobacteria bacterium]